MTWSSWLNAILSSLLIICVPLLLLYLKERTKNIAREQSEVVLANYRHGHELTLAAVAAADQRRLQEFSLYTRRQHAVYSKLYGRVRVACDRYSALGGLSMMPNFAAYTESEVREYLRKNDLAERHGVEALAAYAAGEPRRGAELMSSLHDRVALRDAGRAFARAKNLEAVAELYLSDAVRQRMARVRGAIARLSTLVVEENRVSAAQFDEADTAVTAALADLYLEMRAELRDGTGGARAAAPSE